MLGRKAGPEHIAAETDTTAGIEQGGGAGHVLQRGDQSVERDRLLRVLRQAAGDAHEEVLRRLGRLARLRVHQQVAVVDRTQAEVLEALGVLAQDRVVELAAVGRVRQSRRDQPLRRYQ